MKFPIDRRYLRRLLIAAGCLLAIPSRPLVLASIPLLIAGGALHLWSKGCLEQNRRLTTSGPYRFVRNPFYLANALVDAATCLVISRPSVAAVFAVLWWTTYRATIRAEEAHLTALFGERYLDYVARVPRLLPNGRSLPIHLVQGGFSLGNPGLARGQEYARLLGMALGPMAIVAAARVRAEGAALFGETGAVALGSCVAVVALWIVKLALAEVFRRPEHALLPGRASLGTRLPLVFVLGSCAFAAASWRPWVGVLLALWAVLAGLDALRIDRVARLGLDEAGSRVTWPYFTNAVLGSVGLAVLLWVVAD